MRTAITSGFAAAILVFASLSTAGAAVRTLAQHAQDVRARNYEFLQEQAIGRLPAPIMHAAMLHMLAVLREHPRRPVLWRARGATPTLSMWVSDTPDHYIVGMNNDGTKFVTSIDTQANGCLDPVGLKVDHAQNLWAACELNTAFTSGVVDEYTAGTLANLYQDLLCTPGPSCSAINFFGKPTDVATDSTGDVFAANFVSVYCNGASCDTAGSITVWNANSPSSPPYVIIDHNSTSALYLDVDPAGNLYVDYEGCAGSSCGYGLDEISRPTTSPVITNLIPPGTIGFAGGVYVSRQGTVLNVIDQSSRVDTQYALPFTGAVVGALGPTRTNDLGVGDPVQGGFNKKETNIAIGDAYSWLDFGRVGTNSFKTVANADYLEPHGAAFVPSDK